MRQTDRQTDEQKVWMQSQNYHHQLHLNRRFHGQHGLVGSVILFHRLFWEKNLGTKWHRFLVDRYK